METEPDLSAVSSFMGVLDDDAGDRTNGALPLSSAPPPVREPAPRLWTVLLSVPLVFAAVGIVNLILIGVAVVATVAGIPAALAVFAAVAAGQLALAIVAGALVVVVLGGALLVAGAAFAAFYASFWTLAFVRLENA